MRHHLAGPVEHAHIAEVRARNAFVQRHRRHYFVKRFAAIGVNDGAVREVGGLLCGQCRRRAKHHYPGNRPCFHAESSLVLGGTGAK